MQMPMNFIEACSISVLVNRAISPGQSDFRLYELYKARHDGEADA